MKKKDEDLLNEIEVVIKKHKEEKKPVKKKEESKPLTSEDLEDFLKKYNKIQTQPQTETPMVTKQPQISQQQQPQQQPTKEQQIAYQIWKDAKSLSIVCLIAIVLPFVAILITMFPGGEMVAMIVIFIGVVYPCLMLVKSISIQTRAYRKYGLKPLLQFPKQQQSPPRTMPQISQPTMKNENINKGEIF